jgi:hypothetical protein
MLGALRFRLVLSDAHELRLVLHGVRSVKGDTTGGLAIGDTPASGTRSGLAWLSG